PPTDIYALSLHDALPIWSRISGALLVLRTRAAPHPGHAKSNDAHLSRRPRRALSSSVTLEDLAQFRREMLRPIGLNQSLDSRLRDRKSTRLNSSHGSISY